MNKGHALLCFSERSSLTLIGLLKLPSTFSIMGVHTLPKPDAARSLAIPATPKQSARFGVIAISIIGSSKPKIFETFSPIIESAGN